MRLLRRRIVMLSVALVSLMLMGVWLHAHPEGRAALMGLVAQGGLTGFAVFTVLYNVLLVPFPYDVFLLAEERLGVADDEALWMAATLGMTAAAALDYAGGRWLAPWVRPWLMRQRGYARAMRYLEKHGSVAVALSAVTPLPFSLVCWLAGLARGRVFLLLVAVVVSRGVRNALVLWLG